MELTGKCKEEFKKWLNVNYKDCGVVPHSIDVYWSVFDLFYKLPKSMQYGLLEDYFDSVLIRISINQHNGAYWYDIQSPFFEFGKVKTRTESRTAAIEKANELRNEVLNK